MNEQIKSLGEATALYLEHDEGDDPMRVYLMKALVGYGEVLMEIALTLDAVCDHLVSVERALEALEGRT